MNNKFQNNQAVIYVRVSTKDQVENFSLASQEKACREYCSQNKIPVKMIYREEGESAKTVNRPKFQEMLAYCNKNKKEVGFVVVYAVSRFARSSEDHHLIKAILKKNNIALRSVTELIDDTPEGNFMETIFAGVAQLDNELRAARTRVGMKAALEDGKWTFPPPLGYISSKTTGNKTLVPDPELAPLIKMAFELMSTGDVAIQDVLTQVTALGLRSLAGKPLAPQTFGNLLRNPIYYGRIIVESFEVDREGDFEPIISKELFDQAQIALGKVGYEYASHSQMNENFPLKRFIRCSHCGKALTGSFPTGRKKKKYGYYACWNRQCRAVNPRKEALEGAFRELLGSLSPSPKAFSLFKEILRKVYDNRNEGRTKIVAKLQLRLEALKEKREKLVTKYVYEEAISKEIYEDQLAKLETQIDQVKTEQYNAKSDSIDISAIIRLAENILKRPLELWERGNLEQKQRLQDVFFPEGMTYDGEKLGTAVTSSIFTEIGGFLGHLEELAPREGFEPPT